MKNKKLTSAILTISEKILKYMSSVKGKFVGDDKGKLYTSQFIIHNHLVIQCCQHMQVKSVLTNICIFNKLQ
jgi:hypothetical protein